MSVVHRIESAGMPWMAAANTFDCHPAAAEEAKALESFDRIARAGWIKSASRTEQRTDRPLIDPDQDCQDEAHRTLTFCHKASRLALNSAAPASRAAARALTTR